VFRRLDLIFQREWSHPSARSIRIEYERGRGTKVHEGCRPRRNGWCGARLNGELNRQATRVRREIGEARARFDRLSGSL
jgi:hypothetical protein